MTLHIILLLLHIAAGRRSNKYPMVWPGIESGIESAIFCNRVWFVHVWLSFGILKRLSERFGIVEVGPYLYMGHDPGTPNLYAMLQFNSVIQSVILVSAAKYIMNNTMIDFRQGFALERSPFNDLLTVQITIEGH
jgi:hypothetical protein